MENYFEVSVRDYTNRKDMTVKELDNHKKRLKTKHNKKSYLKRKCNFRIKEIEDLIVENYDTIDEELLLDLFDEIETIKLQLEKLDIIGC
jgi:hypothetical protein